MFPIRNKKGQLGAMGIVTLAVTIMIGGVVIGYVFNSLDTSTLPSSASEAVNNSLDNAATGLTLLAIAIIVAAAMFILALMGSR